MLTLLCHTSSTRSIEQPHEVAATRRGKLSFEASNAGSCYGLPSVPRSAALRLVRMREQPITRTSADLQHGNELLRPLLCLAARRRDSTKLRPPYQLRRSSPLSSCAWHGSCAESAIILVLLEHLLKISLTLESQAPSHVPIPRQEQPFHHL